MIVEPFVMIRLLQSSKLMADLIFLEVEAVRQNRKKRGKKKSNSHEEKSKKSVENFWTRSTIQNFNSRFHILF